MFKTSIFNFKNSETTFLGVGFAAMINCAFLAIYYIVILAWCVFYFFASLNSGTDNDDLDFLDGEFLMLRVFAMGLQKCLGAAVTIGGTRRIASARTCATT